MIAVCRFLAPEILQGKEYDGKAVDIFATGVIFFQLVTAESPFNEASSTDLRYKWIWKEEYDKFWELHEKNPTRSVVVTPELKELLICMWKPNPEERITIEKIKESAWFNGKVAEVKDLKQEFDPYGDHVKKWLEIQSMARKEQKKRIMQETYLMNLRTMERVFQFPYEGRDSQNVKILNELLDANNVSKTEDLDKMIEEMGIRCDLKASRKLTISDVKKYMDVLTLLISLKAL